MMSFEKTVLEVVAKVTDVKAEFTNGTLFIETTDSGIATNVFNALYAEVTKGLLFGKFGSETYYDFV
jgi:hypothetical protein